MARENRETTDHYALLGVRTDASADEIKRAYRKLAVELHPDRNPSEEAEARFKTITLAYQTLSSERRRKRYDEEQRRRRGSIVLWQGPPARTRGDDLKYRLELSFEDAVRGATVSIRVPRKATCDRCDGSGAAIERAPSRVPRCAECDGKGKVVDTRNRPQVCGRCDGRGREPIEACPDCGGEGRRPQEEPLEVPIPAGIDDGRRLRLAGWGDDGRAGGDGGNLFVVVTVAPHPLLRRDGDDVQVDVPVDVVALLLGGTVRVPSVDGPAEVTIPPCTRPDTRITLAGKGVPREKGRGDQIVTLRATFPTGLSPEQRAALGRFASSGNADGGGSKPREIREYEAALRALYGTS